MTAAADCMHTQVMKGTTVMRCVECGEAIELYASAADAIAACRERLNRTKPVGIDEEDEAS